MAITVNTNVYSLAAQKNLARTSLSLETAIQRLSSGLRINQAKDDTAGLAIAQLQTGQARGLTVAQRNIADGISYLGVADSTLQTIADMQQRQRELAVQYASGLYTAAQQGYMSTEFDALTSERPYKKAWPVQAAVDHVRAQAGKHFDPALVALFEQRVDELLAIKQAYSEPENERIISKVPASLDARA